MRVIAGTAGGRRLKELEGMDTRPTTDKVKESMFNVLQFELEGRRILDLFAGTGQLGIEALSRGAAQAVFVERRADAVRLVRDNLKTTDFTEQARVVQGDALEFLAGMREKFDIILLDPVLERIVGFDILSPHGIIVAEHPQERRMPELPAPYVLHKTYRYGRIALTVWRRTADERDEETT